MPNFIFILALCLFSFSCQKEIETCKTKGYTYVDVNETVEPIQSHPYLAAYPGSWWVFSGGYENNCIEKENIIQGREVDDINCTIFRSYQHVMLPNMSASSAGKDIYYDAYLKIEDSVTKTHKLLDTLLASSWTEYKSNSMTQQHYVRRVDSLFTAYDLPNGDTYFNVVKIVNRKAFYTGTNTVYDEDQFYYAKDIGLIREIIAYAPYLGYYEPIDRYLVDYYIAPH